MEKFYPTKAGIEYAALTAQGKIIEFTKGKFGDGVRSTENITELTDLIHPLGELPISKKSVKNSTIITTTQFSNRVGGSILPTFYLMEIGLFAKVVNADGTDDDEHPETLIGYAFDGHGDKIIGTSLSEFIINIPLTVADVNNVTVDIDSLVYPTLKQFEDEVNTRKTEDEELQNSLNVHITDTSNPHGVTAEQIGLDKVPNVATNDQTPTYSQNSTLSNIVSGEKISVSFGKIMKAIADLISHIGSKSNPHSVTKSQVGLDNVPNVATNDQQPTFAESGTRSNIVSGETLSTLFGKIKKFFADLKTVAFTGSYTDLSNKPTSMQNPNSLTLTMNGSATNYNGASSASKSWYAPTSAGTAGYNLISNGSGAPVWQQPPYAVCNTSGSTVAKTVSITNFKLVTGVRVFIKFTYAHDSRTKATLNVNNTGAKSIRYKGYGVFKGYNDGFNSDKQYPNTWEAGEIVEFIYDGTEWVSILEKRKIDHSNIVVGTINVDGFRKPPSINFSIGSLAALPSLFRDMIPFISAFCFLFLLVFIVRRKQVWQKDQQQQNCANGNGYIGSRRILNVVSEISQIGNCEHRRADHILIMNQLAVLSIVGVALGAVAQRVWLFLIRNDFCNAVSCHGILIQHESDDIARFQFFVVHIFNIDEGTDMIGRLHRTGKHREYLKPNQPNAYQRNGEYHSKNHDDVRDDIPNFFNCFSHTLFLFCGRSVPPFLSFYCRSAFSGSSFFISASIT